MLDAFANVNFWKFSICLALQTMHPLECLPRTSFSILLRCILSVYFRAHLVPALKLFRTKFLSGFIVCLFFRPLSLHHSIASYHEMENKSEKSVSICPEYRIRLRTNWILKSINLKIVCNRFTFVDILKHLARLECCLRCENVRAALYPKTESHRKALATEAKDELWYSGQRKWIFRCIFRNIFNLCLEWFIRCSANQPASTSSYWYALICHYYYCIIIAEHWARNTLWICIVNKYDFIFGLSFVYSSLDSIKF